MKRTNIHLTDKQRQELKALSERTGLKAAEHIRRAVDEYLIKQNKKQKGK